MPYIGNVTTSSNVNGSQINNGTITGDKLSLPFNYDSATLYLDDTNNRVGILTASPSATLQIGSGSGGGNVPSTSKLMFGANNSIITFLSDSTSASVDGEIGSWNTVYNFQNSKIVFDKPAANLGQLLFFTQNGSGIAERMRLDSSGRVGIGTTSPDAALTVVGLGKFTATQSLISNGTSGTYSTWQNNGTSVGDIGTGNQAVAGGSAGDFAISSRAGSLVLGINSAEKARIDTSGRLLVGTSTARSNIFNASYSALFQVETDTTVTSQALLTSATAGVQGARLTLAHQRSGGVGGNTILQSGDETGFLSFQGSDGSEFVESASIKGEVDGTPGANDMPGRLVFFTTADGAASPTERLRIDSSGRVGIGTTSPSVKFEVNGDIFASGGDIYTGPNRMLSSDSVIRPLIFGIGAVEKARLDSSGRLGIGTTSPQELLHLKGSAGNAFIRFTDSDGTSDYTIGADDAVGSGGLMFYDREASAYRMVLDSSGRLGIGATSPSKQLSIRTSSADVGITLGAGANAYNQDIDFLNSADSLSGRIRYYPDSGFMSFWTSATERFRISSTGAQSSVIPGGSTLYPSFDCRAWVNFNGTGTVAIRASGNVSSITDNGTGDYTVNFTTAMPDNSYAFSGGARIDAGGANADFPVVGANRANTYLAGSLRINTVYRSSITNTATLQDPDIVAVAIFR
jgi:hypothetical protein